MKAKHSKDITLYYLRRDLKRTEDAIAHHELRAAIPPAACSQPDLFTADELRWAQGYRIIASRIRDQIAVLEGQLELPGVLPHVLADSL